jgi:hypothetical protein
MGQGNGARAIGTAIIGNNHFIAPVYPLTTLMALLNNSSDGCSFIETRNDEA